VQSPGQEFNPFYVWGSVGLGKTHLINAIGNAIAQNGASIRVGYTSAGRFATHLAEAAATGATGAIRAVYARWDVWILDDIQFLAGDIEAQEEFFHAFNALHQSGRQIIIAGDQPPEGLGMLERRLVSRFTGGIVASLKAPDWETRMNILRMQATRIGAEAPDEVLALLAMQITDDIRKLNGSFLKLAAVARLKQLPISLPLAADVLADLGFGAAA
jgi:chromosomal replication initiator protein